MAKLLTSFAELAEVLGHEPSIPESAYEVVEQQHGRQAAHVWAAIVDHEAQTLRRAGNAGDLWLSVPSIAHTTRLPNRQVEDAIIKLATNRLISRVGADGRVAA